MNYKEKFKDENLLGIIEIEVGCRFYNDDVKFFLLKVYSENNSKNNAIFSGDEISLKRTHKNDYENMNLFLRHLYLSLAQTGKIRKISTERYFTEENRYEASVYFKDFNSEDILVYHGHFSVETNKIGYEKPNSIELKSSVDFNREILNLKFKNKVKEITKEILEFL